MAELSEEALLSVLPTIRVPKAGDRVHKDECAFSFDTPVSPPTPAPTTTSIALVIRPGPQALGYRLLAMHPGTCSFPCVPLLLLFIIPSCSVTTTPGSYSYRLAYSWSREALWAL